MIENKYYTPSIEEFHVGFECEIRQADVWEFYRVPANDCLSDLQGDGYRVKYLDKEDIEELGWRCKSIVLSSNPPQYRESWYNNHKDGGVSLRLTDGVILIENGYHDVLFYGKIKNKSELKRLMKQLEIVQ